MRSLDRRMWALLALLALVASACGTRVSHDRVVAAANGQEVSASEGSAFATGSASGGGTTEGGQTGIAPGASDAPSGGDGGTVGSDAAGPGGGTTGDAGAAPAGDAAAPTPGGAPAEGGAPTGAAATREPIVIGSVGNYSGPGGATIGAGPEALRVWAKMVNDRGGVAGHPVEVIVIDDGQDPARHQAAVKDLVENRNVLAFVAQMAPYSLPASIDYVEAKRVPVIGGDCASYLWNESPMLFNQCADLQSNLFGTVDVVAKFGKSKKWGLLTCVEAPACKNAKTEYFDKGLAKEAGVEPLYSAEISIAQPDFTAECLEARRRGVEVITAVSDTNTLERIASSCSRQGYRPQFAQSGGTMDAGAAANPLLEGALISTNTFPHIPIDLPAAKEFQDAFKRYAPDAKLQAFHSLGWTAAKLFETAAAKLGENATREALLESLWSIRNETLGGIVSPMTFNRDKPTPKSRCHFYMAIVKGKQTAPEGAKQFCRK